MTDTFTGPIGTRMSDFSDAYMTHIEQHLELDFAEVPERILSVLRLNDTLIQGFQVSQLVHGLPLDDVEDQAGLGDQPDLGQLELLLAGGLIR